MAKVVTHTAAALSESNSPAGQPWVKLELRDTDDQGNPLTGTDRFFLTVCVFVEADNGSTYKKYVTKQLAAVPAGKMSNAQKTALIDACKSAYSAAVKVVTDDDV